MEESSRRYIDLLKFVLTDFHRLEFGEYKPIDPTLLGWRSSWLPKFSRFLEKYGYIICRRIKFQPENRINGLDWPAQAETMIGLKRLDNLELCISQIIKDRIEGDLIETGVWRGGATIFMKALLKVYGDQSKNVWVADSFEGLPKPDKGKYAADANDVHYKATELAISQETVRANFKKYDLLDERVKFLKGWFKDTLPVAPISKLSLVRLDGDMYESTMDGLVNLYHKLSSGGFIIIDDYEAVKGCKLAVNDFRTEKGISEEMIPIDRSAVYWRKK